MLAIARPIIDVNDSGSLPDRDFRCASVDLLAVDGVRRLVTLLALVLTKKGDLRFIGRPDRGAAVIGQSLGVTRHHIRNPHLLCHRALSCEGHRLAGGGESNDVPGMAAPVADRACSLP